MFPSDVTYERRHRRVPAQASQISSVLYPIALRNEPEPRRSTCTPLYGLLQRLLCVSGIEFRWPRNTITVEILFYFPAFDSLSPITSLGRDESVLSR